LLKQEEGATEANNNGKEEPDLYKIDLKQPYGTALLSDIIAAQWFSGSGAEGYRYSKYFKDMPLPLIALVATAVGLRSLPSLLNGL
jgi:hypothetical protein